MNQPGASGQQLHLTDEQFGNLLAGETLDSGAEAHLRACDHCRGEIAAVRESMNAFGQVSLAWAQRAAPQLVPVPSPWRLRFGFRPVWNVGLVTAATAVVLAVGLRMPSHPGHAVAPSAAVATVAPTGAELAQDNQLLVSINKELSYAPQTAVPVAQLKQGTDRATSHAAEAVSN